MTDTNRADLPILWESTIGARPPKEQFAIWEALYSTETIRRAILKTAMKNQSLNGQMSQDHRMRFASRVMMTVTEQALEHAANKARLHDEMSRRGEPCRTQ